MDLVLNLISNLKVIPIILLIITFKVVFAKILKYFTEEDKSTFNGSNFPKNITFHCSSAKAAGSKQSHKGKTDLQQLVVIFSWFKARDKHLHKYIQLWHKRNFDVLIVKNLPLDLFLPTIGSQNVAKNVVKVLSELNYKEIVVHTFSAGGYQFGEVLVQLLRTSNEKHSVLIKSIKGLVLDSVAAANDSTIGLSKILTSNPVLQSLIQNTFGLYLKLFYNKTVKHYNNSEETVITPLIKCAGLVFYSRNDIICNHKNIEKLIENWKQNGNEIQVKHWEKSSHVLHYMYHKEEYEQELDNFLMKLDSFE